MEAATKDNDIEMGRGTSAADSEPNNCSNSDFEKEETMMVSSSNNQGKSFNLIDSMYDDAAKGDIEKFIEKFGRHPKRLDQLLTPSGNTILHIHITARQRYGNINFVTGILVMCPYLLWMTNKKGETLLHMAARHGHADIAKYLLEECKNTPYQNQHDDQKRGITSTRRMLQSKSHDAEDTALHEAVRYDHLDVVRLLTKEDRELTYEANAVGETPLYLTAERGYTKLWKEILSNCSSPGDHGPYDRTALHVAVIRNDEEMVEGLLEAGEGIHKSKQDQHGWTPLHFAAHLGYIEILKKLLSKDNSAAYKADNQGKTALHVAAGRGQVEIMNELISICPGCCELVDERCRNVLHFALESRNNKAVNLVLENPLLGNLINDKDENGNTPFLHAASIGYYHMRHPKVDIQVFNRQNHNAKDIILGNNTTPRGFEIMLDRSGLRMIVSEIDKKLEDEDKTSSQSNDGKRENRSRSNIMDKARENELVAATLIATVTFAAGFTVPGGFLADKGPDQGAAILTRNTAFRAFVILNTTSMYFSWLAVMINLYESSFAPVLDRTRMPLHLWRMPLDLLRFRQTLLAFAMWAMLLAFLSGTWAVLHSDKTLANTACFVPYVMCAFLQLVYLLLKHGSLIYYLLKSGSTVTEVVLVLMFK